MGGIVLDVGAGRPESAVDEMVEEHAQERRPDPAPAMLGENARGEIATGDVRPVRDAAAHDLPARFGEDHQSVRAFLGAEQLERRDGLVRHHDAANVVARLRSASVVAVRIAMLAFGDHGETVRHRAPVVPARA